VFTCWFDYIVLYVESLDLETIFSSSYIWVKVKVVWVYLNIQSQVVRLWLEVSVMLLQCTYTVCISTRTFYWWI